MRSPFVQDDLVRAGRGGGGRSSNAERSPHDLTETVRPRHRLAVPRGTRGRDGNVAACPTHRVCANSLQIVHLECLYQKKGEEDEVTKNKRKKNKAEFTRKETEERIFFLITSLSMYDLSYMDIQ